MRAGNLRERVTIQAQLTADNGQGGSSGGWQDVIRNGKPYTIWAEVTGLTAAELLKQTNVERSIVTWKVRIRKGSGVTAQNRLMWNGLALNILGVMQDPLEPRMLDFLHCQSGD